MFGAPVSLADMIICESLASYWGVFIVYRVEFALLIDKSSHYSPIYFLAIHVFIALNGL